MKTILKVRESPKSNWRVLCTVDANSNFKDMSWMTRCDMMDRENQMKAAREQRDGWRMNGPWPHASFRIEDEAGELLEGLVA